MRTSPDDPDHEAFRQRCRDFLERDVVPHHAQWERDGIVGRDFWRGAGKAGLLAMGAPAELGGAGRPEFRYAALLTEELIRARVTAPGIVAHNDVAASYLLARTTPEQRSRWVPGLAAGELVAAIAISEPTGGSDLAALRTTARREGEHYVLNGEKAFITNGENADVVVVACRTSDAPGTRGISLIVVERGTPGFTRGERLPTLGWLASDTCNLRFEDCRVPAENLIGAEGAGSMYLMSGMPRERLSIAVVAVSAAELVLADALEHARTRQAFGGTLGSLQHNRFTLATLDTEVSIARVFLEHCIDELDEGRLTVADAAKVKWWTTELQVRVADRALQLHGGHGYLAGNDVSREWINSRVQTIYGGPTEVMKELIGRSLGL
ncbi:acyl-CoA dehydrogenase family protein [Phytoactinopolyspora mesophila]|uniref:Acyl-[acyl-carrier-protein] dehydrogenase MbtN n=1 Tax=Phytoactinopolyspora mesophila TaxID=2650750 RepID=A0A7K3LYS0_9ACTN|nr:acyl-CoA dehydrogenase family protein [Phytoactinopolyspora mesophila]NDL55832.1 acyl-CoA dehydrogenase [Phytoactinopolyspora mesophila]